ncbi:MAG: hypothetical protein ACREYE_04830 [Gammaproteobacteria bacterium]
MRTWYRNARGTHYHEARPDRVVSGLSSCGRSIRRPAFTAQADELLKRNLRVCYDCLVKATRYQ